MVSWSGWHRDRHGSAPVTIDNDGRLLTLRVRGVELAGEDFDALEPVGDGAAAGVPFELSGGSWRAAAVRRAGLLPGRQGHIPPGEYEGGHLRDLA
jgi:hypothetical protein